jgi:hypothetical protein
LINDTRGSFVKPAAIFEFMSNLFKYRFSNRKKSRAEVKQNPESRSQNSE